MGIKLPTDIKILQLKQMTFLRFNFILRLKMGGIFFSTCSSFVDDNFFLCKIILSFRRSNLVVKIFDVENSFLFKFGLNRKALKITQMIFGINYLVHKVDNLSDIEQSIKIQFK